MTGELAAGILTSTTFELPRRHGSAGVTVEACTPPGS